MISKSMVVLSVLLILTYNVMSETETIEKVEEKLGSPANSPVIMWGPLEVNEWVPLPKPPPGWIKHDVSSYVVKGHPH
ncbi:hypothetical protein MSG28_001060 [Choristoneura fumiferana]|uniref:Uncharacterized protein n=1 Tax=Choristoneura fumiferana TaxID=7141 RepID=A0ACC0K3X3_CHOFU|nr:hypothetical protein MSG28_001060 [Choristoneura fumiferana]